MKNVKGNSHPRAPGFLQEAWIRRLRWHFDLFNELYAGMALRAPVFRIGASEARLGEWNRLARTITISERHILEHPWESVLDTLRHEMAHQYVNEALCIEDAPPHGEPFRRACRTLRCDPAAAADPAKLGRLDGSTAERDRILQRIKDLLALAGSPNEHEAANAMRMAHKYLLKYNLDLAEVEGSRAYGHRFLGRCSGRIQEYEYVLSTILQDHFFVLTIWTFSYDAARDTPGRILQVSGTPENVEMAEYVYKFVMHLCGSLWSERRRSVRRGRGTKFQYLAGVLRGFQHKLDRQRDELRDRHGLVWVGDPELGKYYDYLHPRTRSFSNGGVRRSSGYREGLRDGREITLRRGVTGKPRSRGRLLPGPGE